ncbi:MAG TPA: hypothetical protein VNO33_02565 [Kofleriaceae bacterium]|nr:hypothetical protein [Kofleriaceae bacterium]
MRGATGLIAIALSACGNAQPEPAPARPPAAKESGGLRVLFIGNSLTYANDLPGMVQALVGAGRPALEVAMVASPDFSLDDHRQSGAAVRAIAAGRWDFVVLQQGPSSQPQNRKQLRASAATYAPEIRRAGARPALYMVWPSAGRAGDFEAASQSYALAAADVHGLLLPVGDAWRAAWRRDRSLPLYSADGLHPSQMGTYLAALVIHGSLHGESCVGLPASLRAGGQQIEIPPATARLLQEAADEAIARAARPAQAE